MNNFNGVIIEESLENKDILGKVKIIKTEIESVTEEHRTPWIKQWTMHEIEIDENKADDFASLLSQVLDKKHNWYADFKNANFHYIVFNNKVFKVDRKNKEQYDEAAEYGIKLGIPDYQLDFSRD